MMKDCVLYSLPNIIKKMDNEGIFCDEELLFEMWKNDQIEIVLDWRNKGYTDASGTKKYNEIVRPDKRDIFYIKEHGLNGEYDIITEIRIYPNSSDQMEVASLERFDPIYGTRIDFGSLNELSIEDKYLKIIKKSLKNNPINPHGNKKRFREERDIFLIQVRHVLECHLDECIGTRGRVTQEKVAEATLAHRKDCPNCRIVLTSSIDTAKKYLREDPLITKIIKNQG